MTRGLWLALAAIVVSCGRAQEPPPAETRTVSWARLAPNLASDQKRIWTFPVQVARGRHLVPVVAVLGVTALLIVTDSRTAPAFRKTTAFDGFNSVFTSNATAIGTVAAPAALYVGGMIANDSYARRTALLAGEAVAGAEILTFALKDIDNRKRPAAFAPAGGFGDSWFEGSGSWIRSRGSFPSGHAIAAFSVATVFARRYGRRHRWVPYVSYGLAGLVGFSRVTQSAHFPSDVFAGAALGYSISRFAVLRQEQPARAGTPRTSRFCTALRLAVRR